MLNNNPDRTTFGRVLAPSNIPFNSCQQLQAHSIHYQGSSFHIILEWKSQHVAMSPILIRGCYSTFGLDDMLRLCGRVYRFPRLDMLSITDLEANRCGYRGHFVFHTRTLIQFVSRTRSLSSTLSVVWVSSSRFMTTIDQGMECLG